MKCAKVENGVIVQSAIFDGCPEGWVETDAGIGWTENDQGSFDPIPSEVQDE